MALDENDLAPPVPDDLTLFTEVTSSPPAEIRQDDPPAPPPAPEPPAPPPEANIPAARLREEADARRQAERERDEFRRQLDAFTRQQPPKPEAPKRSDMFEQPSAFVQEEVKPLLDPVQQRISQITEHYSLQSAMRDHGPEKVDVARKALESAMGSRDPDAWGAYNRAMASIDPYGEIMKWHTGREIVSTVGNDLGAYRQKILDEAMKDPEFQKRVFEAARGTASADGRSVARPAVPKLPSIGKVGAATSSTANQQEDMSDEELFRAATSGRR